MSDFNATYTRSGNDYTVTAEIVSGNVVGLPQATAARLGGLDPKTFDLDVNSGSSYYNGSPHTRAVPVFFNVVVHFDDREIEKEAVEA